MRILQDENFEILKSTVTSFPELIESNIVNHCEKLGVIDGEPECFGLTVHQAALDFDEDVEQLMLESLGYSNFTVKGFEAFKKLVFLGDGDCPHCGGDLETEMEGGKMYQHDHDSEPYHTGTEVHRCTNCNEYV